jgi:hypothetical protein
MPVNALRRKKLRDLIPEGVVVSRKWLFQQEFSRHALDNLIKSAQLHSIVNGVYTRADSKPTWQGVVFYLQSILGLNLTIGGLTALEMQGMAHYLPMADKRIVHLFGTDKMPAWVNTVVKNVNFIWHSEIELLGSIKEMRPPESIPKSSDPLRQFSRSQSWKDGIEDLIISSPERAYLEVLLDVPRKISFEHADQLLQGLTNLSPRSLQLLLEQCENIKVRRLFFWFAERQKYSWLEKLKVEKINMGSGKRMLFKGGKLDKKYQITVPEYL